MKNISNHGLKNLALAAALTASVATPAFATTSFKEIPINTELSWPTVSNNGIVALHDGASFYKWSAASGLTNLGANNLLLPKSQISNDGLAIAFIDNDYPGYASSVVFNGTQKKTIGTSAFWHSMSFSPDGKKIGGARLNSDGSQSPATYDLTTNIVTANTNPSLLNHAVIDISNLGNVQVLKTQVDEYIYNYTLLYSDGTTKKPAIFSVTDLSGDGKTVIGGGCGTSACSWNSATGVVKALGNNFFPIATNIDASTVVGQTTTAPLNGIIWDATNGARDIKSVLSAKGINISGWSNIQLKDISDNGKYIVGNGKNPSGVQKTFLIQLK